jgi:hypothetical protein
MPQPLKLVEGVSGTLLICRQMCTLLHAHPSSVVLEVEQVLCVPGQRSHPGVEVRAPEVEHSLKALLPYGAVLILNQEKRDRQCSCSGEAVLAQGGEGKVRHHLNADVWLAADDKPQPRFHRVEGYRHAKVTLVQAVGHGQSAMIDRSVPVIAKTDMCIIQHSREPRVVLACGTHSPIHGEVEVWVIIQLQLKHKH